MPVKSLKKNKKIKLVKKQDKVPNGIGKMIYKDGDVEEGLWKNGRIFHPTRYKPGRSIIKTSYAYRFGLLAKIDMYENVIVHPLQTGTPTIRLVIYRNGLRYKGELDGRLQMNGKGILYFKDGSEFHGHFFSSVKRATGFILQKDGSCSVQQKDVDMSEYYKR